MTFCSEVNHCYEEAENFHASFMGQTQATEAHLLALQTVSPITDKKGTCYETRKMSLFDVFVSVFLALTVHNHNDELLFEQLTDRNVAIKLLSHSV